MEKKNKKIIIALVAVVVVIAVAAAAVVGYRMYYNNTHIFVEDAVYEKNAVSLNLRGTGVSIDHVEEVRSQLPGCEIIWELPFQGGVVPHDTTELTVTALSDEDILLLDYLEELRYVDATGCPDYPQIMALQEHRPECEVAYQVVLNGEVYSPETEELSFTQADGKELMQMFPYLPELKKVTFEEITMPAEDLLALVETYPEVAFKWDVDVLGTTYPWDTTAIDLSGTPLEGIEELETALAYLPKLEILELHDCGVDNDVLAEYRARVADHYKVVWTVGLGWGNVIRTDAKTFMPVMTYKGGIWDGVLVNLKYCNEMVCVDLGHMKISHCDWAAYMPELKYLIVADTGITSIEGIRGLQNLEYLECFTTPIKDYSPLLEVPNLKDLNAANSNLTVEIAVQLTSLERLWWSGYPVASLTKEEQQQIQEALPNCECKLNVLNPTTLGWRKGRLYYEMRDVLGMPYFGQ